MPIETIFFDRDGVINEVLMRDGKPASPRRLEEFVLRAEFIDFYQWLAGRSYNLFVVSNQPDISRQLMLPEDLASMTELLQSRCAMKEVVYCIHADADNCHCRKPKPGMITSLLAKYGLNARTAILIGDSAKDVLAARAAGVDAAYLQCDYNMPIGCRPRFVIKELSELKRLLTDR